MKQDNICSMSSTERDCYWLFGGYMIDVNSDQQVLNEVTLIQVDRSRGAIVEH